MTIHRPLLIVLLVPTALASGVMAFLALMFTFVAGLPMLMVAGAAAVLFHTFLCGLTLEHLRRGDDRPWTWIGALLVVVAVAFGVYLRAG